MNDAHRADDSLAQAVDALRDGRDAEAIAPLEAAIAHEPDRAELRSLLGNALKRLGRHEAALAAHREAVEISNASVAAVADYASALLEAGDPGEAARLFEDVVRARPDLAIAHGNLGAARLAAGDAAAAAAALERAVDIDPRNVPSLANLGHALRLLGRVEEAVAILERAVALQPGHGDARWNLALSLLMRGDERRGWQLYEVRRDLPGFCIERPSGPAWDGSTRPEATLLVHAEQGLGDTIQFARHLAEARGRVGRLVFEPQARLRRLLSAVTGADEVVARGAPRPLHDCHAPLLSLPHLLGVPAARAWPDGPRIAAEPRLVAHWRDRLEGVPRPRVGVAWRGSPTYRADRQRSLPVAALAPLLEVRGVGLVSLQRDPGEESLDRLEAGGRVLDLDASLDRDADAFIDTRAVLEHLDLVISSDTAVAHLAATAGVPTWMLLAKAPDWRWGLEGTTTPWYPAMRLYRQSRRGDWSDVVDRIVHDLKRLGRDG